MRRKKRMKQTGESIDAHTLLSVFTMLTRYNYFSYNTHKRDTEAYRYLEEYFTDELQEDPEWLNQFTAVHEITLLMNAEDFRNFIFQVTGEQKEARTRTRYLLKQMVGDRLSVLNVIKERLDPIKAMAMDHEEYKQEKTRELTEVELFAAQALEKMELVTRLAIAVEQEDFELAAQLRDKITALEEKSK